MKWIAEYGRPKAGEYRIFDEISSFEMAHEGVVLMAEVENIGCLLDSIAK